MNGACAAAATLESPRSIATSGADALKSKSPISMLKGLPPKVPYSASYTFLKSRLRSNSGALARSSPSSFLVRLRTRILRRVLVSVFITR